MHELRIAEDMVNMIVEVADKNKLAKVTNVNVQFGEMIQIVPHIFEFAFEEACRNTVADKATLKLTILPMKGICNQCGKEVFLVKNKFNCPHCNSMDVELVQGRETILESIEGE